MRILIFCHSILSDWNHGNAHFLRGLGGALAELGHEAIYYEPEDAWSLRNLVAEHGSAPLWEVRRVYPRLRLERYRRPDLDLDRVLEGADLVLVHEWNEPDLVREIGRRRSRGGGFRLLFHDTHHRMVTAPEEMRRYVLDDYDGVLAFGSVIRDLYLHRGWAARAWTWHEAADAVLCRPPVGQQQRAGDLVWIGNWGDDEREAELREFLLEPVRDLGLRSQVYGVRYPDRAREALEAAGIAYRGWLPNYRVPETFAQFAVTVHVPRRPYAEALPGIPTIRMFEALACGIPLVSAPWDDVEGLFTSDRDFLVARTGKEMREHLRDVLHDPALRKSLAESGRRAILERHTCGHRARELVRIVEALNEPAPAAEAAAVGGAV
jgi:spore maturation protein CgeB